MCLLLTACIIFTDVEGTLREEVPPFPVDSVLLYEHFGAKSGATGDCVGGHLDLWYGANLEEQEIEDIFSTTLIESGWEKTGNHGWWVNTEKDAKIRVVLSVYDSEALEQYRISYTIPDEEFATMQDFATVYVTDAFYITKHGCFMIWESLE